MTLYQETMVERLDRCFARRERLSLGEVEILRGIQERIPTIFSLSHAEEQELQKIERKLNLP